MWRSKVNDIYTAISVVCFKDRLSPRRITGDLDKALLSDHVERFGHHIIIYRHLSGDVGLYRISDAVAIRLPRATLCLVQILSPEIKGDT